MYDIAFSRAGGGRDLFASVGVDGSVRMFDLRYEQHKTQSTSIDNHSKVSTVEEILQLNSCQTALFLLIFVSVYVFSLQTFGALDDHLRRSTSSRFAEAGLEQTGSKLFVHVCDGCV